MADGGTVTDPQVYRAVLVGRYCKAFSCTPMVAERELENDPDQIGLLIMDVWGYLDAKHALDRATNKVDGLKGWDGNPYMTLVEINTFEARQAAQAEADGR